MTLVKSLPHSTFTSSHERNSSIRLKPDLGYALGPTSTDKYQHDQSRKMYCDVLGRNYCQMCCEEALRETSFFRSLTSAEDYISRAATSTSRIESPVHSSKTLSQMNDRKENPIEEDRLGHIVNYVFPIMYRSLSSTSSKVERSRTRTESDSNVTLRSVGSQRHTFGDVSIVSTCSLDSTENFGDDECSLTSERDEKSGGDCHLKYKRQRLPVISRKVHDEFRKSKVKLSTNVVTETEDEQYDKFDGNNVLGLRREYPSKSYHHLVRRSSVVARHVRDRANEKIRIQIAKWTPSVTDEYPRVRNALRRGSNFAQKRREATFQKQIRTGTQSPSNQIPKSYLEKLKQPKVVESILPLEPVVCGITYIKNRWRDEALYKNNNFAIKLSLLRV